MFRTPWDSVLIKRGVLVSSFYTLFYVTGAMQISGVSLQRASIAYTGGIYTVHVYSQSSTSKYEHLVDVTGVGSRDLLEFIFSQM